MKSIEKALLILMTAGLFLPGRADEIQAVHSLKGHQEEGRFIYYINEEKVGTSVCRWALDGTITCESQVSLAGQTMSSSLAVKVDQDGFWTEITARTFRGTAVVKRTGEKTTVTVGAETSPLALEKGTLIMEDMCPILMSQAVRAYDQRKGGDRSFPLFFIPAMPLKASLEFLESLERTVAGEKRLFRKFLYRMNPVYDVIITVDRLDRICLAEYPAQNGLFVRQGFEALRPGKSPADILSTPEHGVVVDKDIGIPMKDGFELATDIYRPAGVGKYPVVLARTPYKKENLELQARFYARRGYVFAAQDVRGRFSSPGEWRPLIHEADDGYETIEWLASRPWANGNVGMIGASYLGWVQWLAASRRPPHLKAMIPNVSPPEAYFNFPHENGALMLATSLWWSNMVERNATSDITGFAFQESLSVLDQKKLMRLPVVELDEALLGRKIDNWREWLHHPDYDAYWQSSYLKWFDRWLKDGNDRVNKEPSVELFIMGPNDWVYGDTYPLENTVMTKYYLSSRGNAAGPVSAVLYASTSAMDTDWVMRLARIDRDGHPLPLAEGITRARYRESFSHPQLLEPGKIYEYRLDLWQTGITIKPGERLMLVVCSALFPKFSRNLNTGGHNELESRFLKADQIVYHGRSHPSHVLLPILNMEEQKKRPTGNEKEE